MHDWMLERKELHPGVYYDAYKGLSDDRRKHASILFEWRRAASTRTKTSINRRLEQNLVEREQNGWNCDV